MPVSLMPSWMAGLCCFFSRPFLLPQWTKKSKREGFVCVRGRSHLKVPILIRNKTDTNVLCKSSFTFGFCSHCQSPNFQSGINLVLHKSAPPVSLPGHLNASNFVLPCQTAATPSIVFWCHCCLINISSFFARLFDCLRSVRPASDGFNQLLCHRPPTRTRVVCLHWVAYQNLSQIVLSAFTPGISPPRVRFEPNRDHAF